MEGGGALASADSVSVNVPARVAGAGVRSPVALARNELCGLRSPRLGDAVRALEAESVVGGALRTQKTQHVS